MKFKRLNESKALTLREVYNFFDKVRKSLEGYDKVKVVEINDLKSNETIEKYYPDFAGREKTLNWLQFWITKAYINGENLERPDFEILIKTRDGEEISITKL